MIKLRFLCVLACLFGGAATAMAQHDHATSRPAGGGTSALSQEQVDQLLAGDGMGLARAAELNHYPGPKHVLDLAAGLKLTPDQRRRAEEIRASMLETAKALGAQIIDAERSLDAAFRDGHIDAARVRALTATIARLQGELRAAHLVAHVALRPVLTAEQVRQYDSLRGHSR